VTRSELFITTKLWPGNANWGQKEKDYDGVLKACVGSLKRLGLDYVDLYLIHAPFSKEHRVEQWRACLELQRRGLCRSVGVSNYAERHISEIEAAGLALPAANQIELHPLNTKSALVRFMLARSILPIAYSSLAPLSSWRATKISESGAVEGSAKSAELVTAASPFTPLAAKYGVTEAQLLLRWAVQHGWPVLPKSSRPERVLENADVFGFALEQLDMAALDEMDRGLALAWDNGDPVDSP
jgi:2,5-diketo-D-gluconate reductase A